MNEQHTTARTHRDRHVPKVVGADAELGNSILGLDQVHSTGYLASRAVLREIDGVPGTGAGVALQSPAGPAWPAIAGTSPEYAEMGAYSADADGADPSYNPQDTGRKFLAENGGCIYIDLNHVEICTPEVRSAEDFVAAWHALLRIVRGALTAANAKRSAGEQIVVLVNSSDGLDNAYGSHLNFLVTRQLFDDLFRKLHPALFVLAAYQVSSLVFTGQGKVGAENGRPPVAYQLSQRADFFDRLVALPTTHDRPIVNNRDEPLCGPRSGHGLTSGDGEGLARLHCIFYDSTLSHLATFLKVGVMQIVLSMLESKRLGADLILADPLAALVGYGHDPDLHTRARLADGRSVSAVELQTMFCERARAYVDAGGCEGLVPGAAAIVELWEETLDLLAQRDFDRLSPRLDWVLKRTQIERALTDRGLDWSAPEAKHLDHLYASLDREEGLYWALEAAGCTQILASEAHVQHFMHSAPEDTRAWTRAMLLRAVPRERIRRVDWDCIELASAERGGETVRVSLPDPLGHTREHWCDQNATDISTGEALQPPAGVHHPQYN